MTDEFAKGEYRRGYQRGRTATGWPAHIPPIPVDSPLVAELMLAARGLRDGFDNMCATMGETDEVVVMLNPKIERLDNAMRAVGQWLLDQLAKTVEKP